MVKKSEKKSEKLDRGTIYKKTQNGNYFFRYQVNGRRKAVSLQTKDIDIARKKAEEMSRVVTAPSMEVVAAHVNHASFNHKKQTLNIGDAWSVYDKHPDKAKPATVSEQQAYAITWREFREFMADDDILLDDITVDIAVKYADHLRTCQLAVDTHNRKIRRLQKIFTTLSEYFSGENPFSNPGLKRKPREEQNTVRRLSFSKDQEQQLLDVLDNGNTKLKNRHEIRILFYLGMFTGQRMKDCALLQWNRIDFTHQRIWVRQFKTGKEVNIPIADDLTEVLKQAFEWKRNEYVLPNVAERYQTVDKNGKNIGANLLNIDVMRVIRWIGVEPSVHVPERKKKVTVYGFHSLRHSFASHCAEAGVPKAVAQSILGADSDVIDKYYVHVGDEAQKKAIQSIGFGNSEKESPQERNKKALEYIRSLKEKSAEVKKIEALLTG